MVAEPGCYTSRWRRTLRLAVFLSLAISLLAPPATYAQNRAQNARSQAKAANTPDLEGFWEPKFVEGVSNSPEFSQVFGKVERAPLRSDIGPMARPQREHPAYGAQDPVDGSACQVLAFPFFMTSSPPFDIVQTPDEILIIPEREGGLRHIYMDGKGHPPDLQPSSNGDSIGHWEGETLVVDTIGFRGFAGVPGGGRRGPSTHLTERYQKVENGQRLVVSFTWADPTTYTKPHTYELNYYKMPLRSTYAFEDWCDSGDPKEYQSVLGISVIGGTSVYNQQSGAGAAPTGQPAQNNRPQPNLPRQ
jgi:hypothetical protein